MIAIFPTYFAVMFGMSSASKILGLLPYPGPSHNLVIMPLFQELAKRGHNVTVAGYQKPNEDIPNYRTILFKRESAGPMRSYFSIANVGHPDYMDKIWMLDDLLENYDKLIATNNNYSDIFGQKYDLVIMEFFEADLFLGYVLPFRVPFILFNTCEAYPWHRDTLGESISPSIITHPLSNRGNVMDFSERFWNTIEMVRIMHFFRTVMIPRAQRIAEKYLGPLPPLNEVTKNASLYFVNSHFSVFGPKPYNPSTIDVGGLHVPHVKPLPKDMKRLLDGSKTGAVYFSLGSVIRGATMDFHKRDIILNVFSRLNQTVLWKYEDQLANKPPNLYTSPWFPQRDILAHPNIVLFISHCGLLGIYEAITEGLPIICMPLWNDQYYNAAALERLGMGIVLQFASLTEDSFRNAIDKIIQNPSYKENAQKVSKAFNDRPLSAMDTAVYWTEYVLRHQGATHMRTPARFMAWWEYYNIDVLAVLLSIFISAVIIFYIAVKTIILRCLRLEVLKGKAKSE